MAAWLTAVCPEQSLGRGDRHTEKSLEFSGWFQRRAVYRLGMVMEISPQWPISEGMEWFLGVMVGGVS